jgi:hypothetical protein
MTRRIKIRERCWNNKRTWGECDSNLIANDTRHGYCNIQQCEYHGIVMLLDKQLAFIEAKVKEYFQLHNKQMWESSKKIKIKHFTFTFQLHQSHKPKQENNLGQTWHKLATSHKCTLDSPQLLLPCEIWTTLPCVALCGFGIKAAIFLGLQRCTSKTRTLYNSNLRRITTFQKHICFENVAPISYNSQRYLCN